MRKFYVIAAMLLTTLAASALTIVAHCPPCPKCP